MSCASTAPMMPYNTESTQMLAIAWTPHGNKASLSFDKKTMKLHADSRPPQRRRPAQLIFQLIRPSHRFPISPMAQVFCWWSTTGQQFEPPDRHTPRTSGPTIRVEMASETARDRDDGGGPRPSGRGPLRFRTFVPWWALLGVVAVATGFALDIVNGVTAADEAWFLYVLHRVDVGQVLYRDVWVPVFPLAIWTGAAFTKVFGDHIFVLKALDSLVFAGTVIACVAVARRIAPKYDYAALVLAVMLGWAAPGVVGPGLGAGV